MRLSRILSIAAIIAVSAAVAGQASAATETFDTPVVTGSSPAPGVWYTDRYAPAGFASPTPFGGDNRLQEDISVADSAANRPSAFSSTFYDTQGRALDLGPGAQNMRIDLYVPQAWASTDQRMAGFWGVARDNTSSVSAYPIIEFASDGGVARFQGWDNAGAGSWIDMGLPTGFSYDSWYTLSISLDQATDKFVYKVGDLTASTDALGSTSIGSTILQGYNKGSAYSIEWDNLTSSAGGVPEPATWAMMLVGIGGLGATMRRRRREQGAMAAA